MPTMIEPTTDTERYLTLRARIQAELDAHERLWLERTIYNAQRVDSELLRPVDEPLPPPPAARPRGRVPNWIRAVVDRRHSNLDIAETVLSACLQKTLSGKREVPSAANVSVTIAKRLKISVQDGYSLLQFAFAAGVAELGKQSRDSDRVYLPGGTLAAFTALEGPVSGLRHGQSARAPKVTRRLGSKVEPFVPRHGSPALRAALKLRSTKWAINRDMYATVEQITQGRIPVAFTKDRLTRKERWEVRNHIADVHALREARQGRKSGYFRVRFDHRGRLYQVGKTLTYTSGRDAARAMLEFANRRKVRTEAGLRALARHLIEHAGERVPMSEELKWIEANKALIDRPDGRTFGFVAACRAWHAVERGEPIGLPVSIDATQSAVQHMALLLRNERLAAISNVWPNDARQDVYQRIADACGGGLPRDLAKPVAMPTFYGQTLRTACDKLMREWPEGLPMPRDKKELWDLARRIKKATVDVVPEAFVLYYSLRDVAAEITKRDEVIRWTTPSGWECALDRRKAIRDRHWMRPSRGYTRHSFGLREFTDELSLTGQRNSITANLIHSLDASLLHLAVADLPEEVDIATAHDCFATHADDIPLMRSKLAKALSEMYEHHDQLGTWWGLWGVDVPLPALVRGEWDGRFLQGEYAFS